MDLLFPYGKAAHWVGTGGFVITIWLGAYLATNAPRSFPSRLAILSLLPYLVTFCTSSYACSFPQKEHAIFGGDYWAGLPLSPGYCGYI